MTQEAFRFKQFSLKHDKCAHKIGTDAVLLGSWLNASEPKRILDIGSGSGVISFILAQRFPNATITGIELDLPSYEQSINNLETSKWKDRINFIYDDFLDYQFPESSFDLIVSNPPFFKQAYLSGKTSRDKARHEFSLPHGKMLDRCEKLMTQDSSLALILPVEEGQSFIAESSLFPQRLCSVKNKADSDNKRILIQMGTRPKIDARQRQLIIRDINGQYSSQYEELTRDFYLNF